MLGHCDGVLSGYIGSAEIGAAILDAVAQVKRANPRARYCCDPVIGDVGRGVFVQPGVAEFMRDRAVPAADIVTPNHFELDHLTGRTTTSLAEALAAVEAVARAGAAHRAGDLADDRGHAGRCDRSARLRRQPAAIACARRSCRSRSTARATPSPRCSSRIICAPARPPRRCRARPPRCSAFSSAPRRRAPREILLIEAQDELVNPSRVFSCRDDCLRRWRWPQHGHCFAIERFDLRFAPRPWPFADGNRAAIDAHFAAKQKANPALWNGRVLLAHEHGVTDGVCRGAFLETDFASFSAWRDWGRPPAES